MQTPTNILAFITHQSLSTYKRMHSRAPLPARREAEKNNRQKQGVVFVSRSKEELQEARGHVVTSYETLQDQQRQLTHWTPNTFLWGSYTDRRKRILRGHRKDNLKQINTIVLDIDTKQTDLYALFLGCAEENLPDPSLIVETPRGYHVYFVLEEPMFISPSTGHRSLKVAERIADNMKQALATYVPIDTACNPFGFFRMPTADNVKYQSETKASVPELIAWSQSYEQRQQYSAFHVVHGGAQVRQIDQVWYQTLLQCRHITSGHYTSSRNNTLLTLAIANYASGRSYDEAYDELDEFNSRLEHPLSLQEFRRTMASAYSGRYQGAKRTYIDMLLMQWTGEASTDTYGSGWYKFKKDRSERQRSHYEEWETDILRYLELHTSSTCAEELFLEGSQAYLAEQFGMAVSTLKEVLKRSTKLVKIVKGRGRGQRTYLASRAVLFAYLLYVRQERVVHATTWKAMVEVLVTEAPFPVNRLLAETQETFTRWATRVEQHFRSPWIC
ncbi:hypothetical protein AAV35_013895 (plasmid) [Salimicrobium jeotgali]|uniref:Plasmid replication protein n=1 Tax=Salimicrobium jeotgali TaxID=1230341 RepID=K2FID2_9BACI|nr:primase C-terminal domain-containing protein [Salimicrobium jeotgali]AKG05862.1 hypothetical protein AAV35_013895 [Salimicrobium jeotgali]EKE30851.1 plasmid replication protein [Salimicrobium jeotgali]MBM7697439.1 exonuclease VII small subunit [Salimicrobium jeotgali]